MSKKKNITRFFEVHPGSEQAQLGLNIFNLLKTETSLSVNTISEKTGIANDFIASYIDTCVKKDLLRISGSDKGELVKFNSDKKLILGVGFNDGECVLTAMDLAGEVQDRESISMDGLHGWKGKNKDVAALLDEVSSKTKMKDKEFCCAGVAIPEGLAATNANIADLMSGGITDIFGCEVFITKGTTAAGYGEWDASKELKGEDLLYMHSDIGIGVIIRKEIIFEADEKTAEEAKSYLRPWNQFSIVDTAKNLVNKGVGTDIVKMVNGDVNEITLKVVLDAAEKEDELSEDLIKRSGLAMGVRVAYLVNMFDAETVILGGGTERGEGGFLGYVQESAAKFLLKDRASRLKIIPGKLGKEASSIGAASLCRRELFMEV